MAAEVLQIDKTSLRCFGRTVVRECMKFYADPKNMKRFEEWKAQKESTGSPIGDYRDGVGAWSDCQRK